jgi:hypothetical protein
VVSVGADDGADRDVASNKRYRGSFEAFGRRKGCWALQPANLGQEGKITVRWRGLGHRTGHDCHKPSMNQIIEILQPALSNLGCDGEGNPDT